MPAFAQTLYICRQWESKIISYCAAKKIFRQQSARGESRAFRKIEKSKGRISAHYKFINFNRDRISVSFSMAEKQYRRYVSGYGYKDSEIETLRQERKRTRRQVWKAAYDIGGKSAAQRALKLADAEFNRNLKEFLESRGFKLLPGNKVEADIPSIAKRNKRIMNLLARTFQKISRQRAYDSYDTIGAVVSMVQTALLYKVPPLVENGKHTGGVLPPARAMLSGWGDCDTKSALAMAVLSNWSGVHLVGVAVPHHYLFAIKRVPGKRDLFVRYNGAEYVLIEAAGPAWLEPGRVGDNTMALIDRRSSFKIEPI